LLWTTVYNVVNSCIKTFDPTFQRYISSQIDSTDHTRTRTSLFICCV